MKETDEHAQCFDALHKIAPVSYYKQLHVTRNWLYGGGVGVEGRNHS